MRFSSLPLRRLLVPLLLAGSPFAAAAADTAPAGLSFQHHDWMLACDNTRTCRAAGYAERDDGSTQSVLLVREGGPNQPVRARISLQPSDEMPVPGSELYLHLRQHSAGRLAAAADDGSHALTPKQVAALLDVLVRGGQVDVVDNDTNIFEISGRGAAAVLLKMDEFQGRLSTPGAIMRKGSKPEAGVPAGLPLPVLHRAATLPERPGDAALAEVLPLRDSLRGALGKDEECTALQPESDNDTLTVHRLDAQHVLVSATCWSGAYNAAMGWWVVRDSAPYKATLVTLAGNDYQDGVISAAHKGRGIGDCWSHENWAWDGRRFVQVYAATTGMCRSVPGGTWDLPTRVSDLREP